MKKALCESRLELPLSETEAGIAVGADEPAREYGQDADDREPGLSSPPLRRMNTSRIVAFACLPDVLRAAAEVVYGNSIPPLLRH